MGQGPADIDGFWLAKGQTELGSQLGKMEALLDKLEEVREADVQGNNPKGVRSMTSRSVRFGANTLIEKGTLFIDPKQESIFELECENVDYHFSLTKSKASSPFALTEYTPGQAQQPVWRKTGALHTEVYYHLERARKALAPENRANLHAVRFDQKAVNLSIVYMEKRKTGLFTETILIEPDKSWTLKSRQTETSRASHVSDYTYGKVIDGVNLPTGSTSLTTPKGQKGREPIRIVVRVTDVRRTTKSPEDFRLAAFGLPEPGESIRMTKRTPWYVWLLLAAGVCGLLSFGCVYLRRRLRSSQSTP